MNKLSAAKSARTRTRAKTMSEIFAETNWKRHPFGEYHTWPPTLKVTLSLCLHSRFPMAIYWGKDMLLLYNDAWGTILGDKHPWAFGRPAEEVWSEIWHIIEKPMKQVLKTGKGSVSENVSFPLSRRGFVEECYFDYTLNPIFNTTHDPEGILNVSYEITSRILAERRNTLLRKLSEKSLGAESPDEACILVTNVLSEAPADVPYASIHLLNGEKTQLRLAATTSIEKGTKLAPAIVDLNKTRGGLPLATAIRTKRQQIIRDLNRNYALPGGIWDEPSRHAAILPLIHPQSKELFGVMVLGISPRLFYDASYRDFFCQITEHTALAIGAAYDLRRKLILEAREHEVLEQLQTALASSSVGVWSWDIETDTVIADNNLLKIFNVDEKKARSGLPAAAFSEHIHPADRAHVQKSFAKGLKKGGTYQGEYRIGEKNNIKWVMARGKAEFNSEGKPVRVHGVVVDITERKVMENMLSRHERRFRALFDSSIIGVAIGTMEGKILEANKTFLKMFGLTNKDIEKGLPISAISTTKATGGSSNIFQQLRKHGEAEPIEREYKRKDGTIIPTLVGAAMIADSKDRFITFILDISEQRHLRELSKAKDEFISIASHQLRTPATGVKQYLGMIMEGYVGPLDKEQMKILKTAYESNERQLNIVNDLLRVAQADAREVKLNREPTNLVELTKDILLNEAHKFAFKHQPVSFSNGSSGKAMAFVDPSLMRMVLENVLDNAYKYTPAFKKISVSISTGKKQITIRIKDEGVGIRKGDMQKLFKKFSRIENQLSTSAGGTGLGLYWVDKIIQLHDGTISATSKYKEGTEFVIKLPTWYKGK